MATQPLRQLITVLRNSIRGGNHTRALRLLATNLPLTGGHYRLRRYAADVLREMDRSREAMEVYEILVRHFTNSGHPLMAIQVAHELVDLEPDVDSHFEHLARVYGQDSPFIDRDLSLKPLAMPQSDTPLDLSGAQPDMPLNKLIAHVHELAIRKEQFVASPEAVPPIPLLSRLDTRTLRTLVAMMRPVRFSDEEVIASSEAPLKSPKWLVHGHATIQLDDGRHAQAPPGSMLGHRTLLGEPANDQPLRCVAHGNVEALTIDADTMPMIQGDAKIQQVTALFDQALLVDRALKLSKTFGHIPRAERDEALRHMEIRALRDNTTLIHQGQSSDGLYLVVDGRVDVNKRDGEWDVTFKTLAIGDVVGEISLVTDGMAVASVVTDGPTRVIFIPAEHAKALCDQYPAVLAELRESAANRLLDQEE